MTARPQPLRGTSTHPSHRPVEPALGYEMAVPIVGTDSAGVFISWLIGQELHTMVTNESIARVGIDPDGVHQQRVAGRRLRCHLRHFRDLVEPAWLEVTMPELRWIGTSLGTVRDLEVMRDVLSACAASLPSTDVQHLEPLFAQVTHERNRAHADLQRALDSDRYVQLLASLTLAAAETPLIDDVRQSALDLAQSTAARAVARLDKSVQRLGPTPTDIDLHFVRLRAKRARFASEAAIPLIGNQARKLAKSLANVQSVLGTQHDAVVAHHWVRAHALHEEPSVNFSAGMVAGLLRNASQQAAREFPAVWNKASREKLRSWL